MEELQKKANLVRKWSLIATTQAGSGHPSSCLSAADLMAVLFDKYFIYDLKNPNNPNNDRLVFSKGHAAPLLYTLYAIAGAFPLKELTTLRQFDSRLEGHPTPRFTYSEVASGSLGQGLSVGAGLAYGIRSEITNHKSQITNLSKVYVLLGDGELAEGSVWEAANFASYYKLDNLIAIVDVNRLGQSQKTMFQHDLEEYVARFSAFGWEVLMIDGHDVAEVDKAFQLATVNKSSKPFAIIAKTLKGKGISLLENKDGWHGKALKKEQLEQVLPELGNLNDKLRFKLRLPRRGHVIRSRAKDLDSSAMPQNDITFKIGEEVATREVYGKVLAELADSNPYIFALDGDVKNSTFSMDFIPKHPDRFIECFIAEQNMVGVALGLSRLGKIPFVSTFSAFFTRAFDQIRMSSISEANIKFIGSHAGVSIGEDGSSQMGLEDMAMFGVLPHTVIFHPADAVSSAKTLSLMLSHKGISYLRTLRPKTPVIYKNIDKFTIGGSKILRSSKNDVLTVVACGITVHEALKAYEELKKENLPIRVVDCYSVKPIDEKTLKQCSNETMKQVVITVEDHFEHGGLGDFVLDALSDTGATVVKLAVYDIAHSGKTDELLDAAGISAKHIIRQVKACVS